MVDLLASAERCRVKASHCEQWRRTASPLFAKCYRELAQLLILSADSEEDFVRRDMAAKQQANEHLMAGLSDVPVQFLFAVVFGCRNVHRENIGQVL
jgi:hypothetical protein